MDMLVIGGSGHLSGAVVRAALEGGHQVWALTRGQRSVPKGATALVADRHEPGAMEAAIAGQERVWDLVVDCICYDLPALRQDLELFCRRARQFVLISTDFVYHPAHRRFPQPEEASHWAGAEITPYGHKKRLCELELSAAHTVDLGWTVLRPCRIYGPTSELGCLPLHGRDPQLIAKLRAGHPLQLVGGGHFLQQPILAEDLARTILSIGGNPEVCGKIFNTAGPEVIESRQYYQLIAEILGVELQVEEIPVSTHLAAHPEAAPFLCHRTYDLDRLAASGLSVPATPVAAGLRQHVEGLLARKAAPG
jgi:nucleoside-diphosphate-sugar epimerase